MLKTKINILNTLNRKQSQNILLFKKNLNQGLSLRWWWVGGGAAFRNHVLPRAPPSSIKFSAASESRLYCKLVANAQKKGTASVFKVKIN
jgi:hypothetical protein